MVGTSKDNLNKVRLNIGTNTRNTYLSNKSNSKTMKHLDINVGKSFKVCLNNIKTDDGRCDCNGSACR